MAKQYKSTVELNGNKSPSTGSATAFYGRSPWKDLKVHICFLKWLIAVQKSDYIILKLIQKNFLLKSLNA